MKEFVDGLNNVLWSTPVIYILLGVGLLFSVMTRFLQVRHVKEMVKLMFQGKSSDAGVSSFQALAIALSGRVGTGNIAGVATAIAFGGPELFSGCGRLRSSVHPVPLLNRPWPKFTK